MWIAALVFTSVLIVFLMAVFFLTPNMTPDQRRIVHFLFPLLAGFSTFFLGGSALLEFASGMAQGAKLSLSATAGVAVFFACYLYPPYFLRLASAGVGSFTEVETGVEATKALLKSPVPTNVDGVAQRKKFAKELYRNCRRWSQVLLETFDKAGDRWVRQGKAAATEMSEKQQRDLMKLDYWSLESNSQVLGFLKEDERFRAFADACSTYYRMAIDLNAGVHGRIRDSLYGETAHTGPEIAQEVAAWKERVESMLHPVTDEYQRLKTTLGF